MRVAEYRDIVRERLLSGDSGPRLAGTETGAEAAHRAQPGNGHSACGDQRCSLRAARKTMLCRTCCCASAPARRWKTKTGMRDANRSDVPEKRRRRWRRGFAHVPEALENTAADRRRMLSSSSNLAGRSCRSSGRCRKAGPPPAICAALCGTGLRSRYAANRGWQ